MNRPFPRCRPEYRDRSIQRSYPDPDAYDSDPFETASDYVQCRPRVDIDEVSFQYPSSYQAAPRIKPETYTGNEDWEEYQSHFVDCA